jgi:hypothetical protein
MASQWFCKVLGREIGPVGFPELVSMVRSGTLNEGDPVRREGASQWTRAGEVIGLFRTAAKEPARAASDAGVEPPPTPAPQKTKDAKPPPAKPPRIRRRQALSAGGVVLGVVVLVTVVSAWRANRRERFPVPYRGPREPVDRDVLAPLAAKRSSAPSVAIPEEPVPQPVEADAGNLHDRFTQDFRQDVQTQAFELMGGSPADQYYSFEPAGLRVTVPDGCPDSYFAVTPRIIIKGDFLITARYTILNWEPPTSGFGTIVGLMVVDGEGERAAVERRQCVRQGHVFCSYRGRPKPGGGHMHATEFRETSGDALSGWLRLRRVGGKIRYQIASHHSDRFVQVHEEEYPGDGSAKLRLVVQTGGSPIAVDTVWSYVDVQADELVETY